MIGAGAFGVAAADALAGRGWRVRLVDRFAPVNARGSSGDGTRLLRLSHGDEDEHGDWLLRSAERGIAGWRALEETERLELVVPTGLVILASAAGGAEQRALDRLRRAGVAHERLGPDELQALFPELSVEDVAFGVHEPGACVIRARDAVLALLRRARRLGVEVVRGTARPAGPGRAIVDGEPLEADAIVWACGAWLGELFGDDAPVRPTWQEVVHWHAPPTWSARPAWFDGGFYGFPDVDGLGMKAVTHVPGPGFDLERDARIPRAEAVAALASAIAHRFPGLPDPAPLWSRVMPYEMTPDGRFVVGPSPTLERHWLLGGGSGHGFKHAPALGEHVADLLEGRAELVPQLAPGLRQERPALHASSLG